MGRTENRGRKPHHTRHQLRTVSYFLTLRGLEKPVLKDLVLSAGYYDNRSALDTVELMLRRGDLVKTGDKFRSVGLSSRYVHNFSHMPRNNSGGTL